VDVMMRKPRVVAMLETTLRIKHLRWRARSVPRARVTRRPMLTCATPPRHPARKKEIVR
jgi:hypothetical protein